MAFSLFFFHYNFFYFVSSLDLVDDVYSFYDFPEAGMVSVEVLGVFPIMADKELRATCVSSCMRH